MKLGVFSALYGGLTFDEALAKLKSLGVESVEIPAGGYPGKSHCDPEALLSDRDAFFPVPSDR